jgi:hypothetical protein
VEAVVPTATPKWDNRAVAGVTFALYPVYVRGEAYLAAHEGSEAAAELQKILGHRGVVANEPIGALAHLGLARAYALQGGAAKARAAYNDFFNLWKDADPDIPIPEGSQSGVREAEVRRVGCCSASGMTGQTRHSQQPGQKMPVPTSIQAAVAVPGGCGRICSSIFSFISFAVGSALWVPTIHGYPSRSTMVPHRSPQNMSITWP